MSAELWIKRPCKEHGRAGFHRIPPGFDWCEGGSEERLDPERTVPLQGFVVPWPGQPRDPTIQDVLNALGES